MKYFIFGAGNIGRLFYKKLPEQAKLSVCGFIDNDKSKQGEMIEGKKIMPMDEALALADNIIIAMKSRFMLDAYKMVKNSGYTGRVYVMKQACQYSSCEEVNSLDVDDHICAVSMDMPLLEQVETDIVAHCNLKCKHCGHRSNVLKPEFMSIESFNRDVSRLAELYAGCERFKILGGEPLLHPKVGDFVKALRRSLPLTVIYVTTNGLLLPKIKDGVLKDMRSAGAIFEISCYPPTQQILHDIHERCNAYGIECVVSSLIKEFYVFENREPCEDMAEAYRHCLYPKCHSMKDGYIAVCGAGIFGQRNAEMDGKPISDEEFAPNRINLYDTSLTGEKLNKLLRSPIPLCRSCGVREPKAVPWESENPTYNCFKNKVFKI